MSQKRPPKSKIIFVASPELRQLLIRCAAKMAEKKGERVTMTDAIAEGVRLLAKREGVS